MRARAVFHVLAGLTLAGALVLGCRSRALDRDATGKVGADAGGGGGGSVSDGGGASDGGGVPDGGIDRVSPDPIQLGQRCAVDRDCASGHCADGVCCDVDCAGDCHTCAAPGALGTCVARAAGDTPRTRAACPVEIVMTCGEDGTCDGAGSCRLRPAGTRCGGGSCDGDAVVGVMSCNGRGSCVAGPSIICVPYHCDPVTAACRLSCTTDGDCVAGTTCQSGRCQSYSGSCTRDDQCASRHCAQGVCCNTACDGPCTACNMTGRQGTCWPRPSGTDCGNPICQDGVVTGLKRCDTAANCVDWASVACSPFTCDPSTNLCRNSCANDPDCDPPFSCVGGSCGRRESPTCDSGGQCLSGWCSRGICCDARCDDPCHSCSVPGSIGVCQQVATGCPAGAGAGLP